MIQKISFKGKVCYLGDSDKLSTNKLERMMLKRYAKKNDCDIAVLKRDSYMDNTGIYETLTVKQDKITNEYTFAKKTYDFGEER